MQVFRSLRSRNFKLFFSGQSVSLIGSWMQRTAISWLVYRITGSAFLLGVVNFASLIPLLFLSPYVGSFIDRHNRYKLLVVMQCLAMVQAGTLAALVFFEWYNITAIIILCLAQGVIKTFSVTCRQSLMIDLIDEPEDLPNAIALNSTMANFARIAGPVLAGILISAYGEDACFISNFFSFFAVLASLFFMKVTMTKHPKPDVNIWEDLREGFRYISQNNKLFGLITLLAVLSLFVIPFSTLMPIFAKTIFHGDAKTFSWFESAIGVGAIISAIYVANRDPRKNIVDLTIRFGFVFGVSVVLLALANQLNLALICVAFCGVGMMAVTSSINIYIQSNVVSEMRGRAISYYIMAYQGVIPLGSLLVGFLANEWGASDTVLFEGIMGIIAITAFYFFRRNVNKKEALPA